MEYVQKIVADKECSDSKQLSERVAWIDSLKGIAIMLVVIGHNSSNAIHDFLYCFHMPIFFIVAGFLFSPKPIKTYAKKSFTKFIIPYICYLLSIFIGETINYGLTNCFWGGVTY